MKHATRVSNLPAYPFAGWAAYVERVQQRGDKVIRLDIGNPDMPPPDDVVEALCSSAKDSTHHGYTGYRGILALREAMAAYYERRFGVRLDLETQVVPLIGSKEGIVNISLAYLDPGDLALVPDPGYPPYTMGAALAGARVHRMPLLPERDFLADLEGIPPAVAQQAKLMWLNYPNNPTGSVAGLDFLEQAVGLARQNDLLLCHDTAYCDLTFGGYTAPSVLQVPGALDVAVEFNSLSKTYNMAGWRIGMAVGNTFGLQALAQVKQNVDSGIFRPIQEAAVRALATDPEWITARNKVYAERREIVLAALSTVGVRVLRPRATPYIWMRVPQESNSEELALALLEKAAVAVAPGCFFGPGGEGYVRISVTASTPDIVEAVGRLTKFLADLDKVER